mgnify:CR=1 FL=1
MVLYAGTLLRDAMVDVKHGAERCKAVNSVWEATSSVMLEAVGDESLKTWMAALAQRGESVAPK